MKKQKASVLRRLSNQSLLAACVTLLGSFSLVSCQQKPIIQASPCISYDRTKIDLGEIRKDTIDHKYEFKYSNVGGGILKMENVSTSCFCTTAEFSEEELKLGEEGILTVTLNLKEVSTQMGMLREIYVKTNASDVPDTLALIGNVVK